MKSSLIPRSLLALALALLCAVPAPVRCQGPDSGPSFDGLVSGGPPAIEVPAEGSAEVIPAGEIVTPRVTVVPAQKAGPSTDPKPVKKVIVELDPSLLEGEVQVEVRPKQAEAEATAPKAADATEKSSGGWKKAAWIAGGIAAGVGVGLLLGPMAGSFLMADIFIGSGWAVGGVLVGGTVGGLVGKYLGS